MFTSILKKTVASATAVGSVIALAALTAPATVSSAPAIEKMACQANYPNPIQTSTNVRLADSVVPYGARNSARVTVTSGTGTPTGTVTLSGRGFSKRLAIGPSGSRTTSLPRRLDAGNTYTIRARFRPNCADDNQYSRSSDSTFLTVIRARTSTTANANNIERRDRVRVTGRINSGTLSPGGRARVSISKGRFSSSKVVRVRAIAGSSSVVRATFGPIRRTGRYTAKVSYLGTGNFRGSSDTDRFTVRRR